MFRNVVIIFGMVILIFLMMFISLINGIQIENLSFKNVNIQGLYLKYDKKLIVDTRNISIVSPNGAKKDIKLKLLIDGIWGKYNIKIEQFLLRQPHIKASGDVELVIEEFTLDGILNNLVIENFALQFHKNLPFVKADRCFVKFSNNTFDFNFENLFYDSISLEGSRATIREQKLLHLQLMTQEILQEPILTLLKNYNIQLPITQQYGSNSTFVDLIIPLSKEEKFAVTTKANIEDGKIFVYGIPIYIDQFEVSQQKQGVWGKGKLSYMDHNSSYNYSGDVGFDIDFTKKAMFGDFLIHSGRFEDINFSNFDGDFDLDFQEKLVANVAIKGGDISLKEENFKIKNSKTTYKDEKKMF